MALGVYGAGNIGQSLAAFGSPVLAAALGFRWGFWTFGVLAAGLARILLVQGAKCRRAAHRRNFQ